MEQSKIPSGWFPVLGAVFLLASVMAQAANVERDRFRRPNRR